MAHELLASSADLTGRLGRDLTAAEAIRVPFLLADASAAVRREAGQIFTAETSTWRTRPRNGRITLPQRPVDAVLSVTDVDGNAVGFEWDGLQTVTVATCATVDVTYDHGSDEIPQEIVAVVCQVAARALGRPADGTGVTSESIAGYSYTVGSAAAAGGVGLLPDEKRICRRYRTRPVTVIELR